MESNAARSGADSAALGPDETVTPDRGRRLGIGRAGIFHAVTPVRLGAIERAIRRRQQVFDIVAVNVQEFTPELAAATPKARALHLRMLRHAIERGPDDLQMILREVLDLPERKQKELAALLQETTLSAIITAAKTVADRLKFIAALESIVFDLETKGRLKERSQLHKILAENTWVLGEEYNLWASDKDLKRVLEKHRAVLDPDIVIDDPVKVIGKKRGIVDLMLSRATRRHRARWTPAWAARASAPTTTAGAAHTIHSAENRWLSRSGAPNGRFDRSS